MLVPIELCLRFFLNGVWLGWHLRKWAIATSVESGAPTEPLAVENVWTLSAAELRERCHNLGIYRKGAVKDAMVRDLLEKAMQF